MNIEKMKREGTVRRERGHQQRIKEERENRAKSKDSKERNWKRKKRSRGKSKYRKKSKQNSFTEIKNKKQKNKSEGNLYAINTRRSAGMQTLTLGWVGCFLVSGDDDGVVVVERCSVVVGPGRL